MDMTQAEAVIDLIRAKTDLALRSATEQLEGRLGQKIRGIRDELIALIAHIEASIDFPEEDIAPDDPEKLQARLDSIGGQMSALLATADQGRILREGVRVVIYGPTNAGKSSLLNRLLGYDRVIVSEAHGTTRDTIEEIINLRGIPVRLLDTAGLRTSADQVERDGIARTERSLQTADLRLHIADCNAPKTADFDTLFTNGAELILLNKSDLPEHADWKQIEGPRISCMTGEGIRELEDQILARITTDNLRGESAISINMRHRDCLRRALEACDRAGKAMRENIPVEYIALDLNEALRGLGEVIGEINVEQILDSVFGQFCIGK
jgi:tRNA modification GTPase